MAVNMFFAFLYITLVIIIIIMNLIFLIVKKTTDYC
jgi:hypothetical protein